MVMIIEHKGKMSFIRVGDDVYGHYNIILGYDGRYWDINNPKYGYECRISDGEVNIIDDSKAEWL